MNTPNLITKAMLAVNVSDYSKLTFPKLATPKLDGIRCLKPDVTAVSRNWKAIKNRFIRKWIEANCPAGFDGELMLRGSMNFQEVSSAVMSEDGESDFEYWVFDYVTTDLARGYNLRMSDLRILHANTPSLHSRVKVVEPTLISNQDELDTYEEIQLKAGYEGVMLREPSSPYKLGRSSEREAYLLKVKRFEDSECVILEVKQKRHNTNEATTDVLGRTKRSSAKAGMELEETVGGFIVRDVKSNVEFNIGSGLNEQPGSGLNRHTLWDKRAELVGKVLKYQFQPTGVKDAPRFPTILGFRDAADMD